MWKKYVISGLSLIIAILSFFFKIGTIGYIYAILGGFIFAIIMLYMSIGGTLDNYILTNLILGIFWIFSGLSIIFYAQGSGYHGEFWCGRVLASAIFAAVALVTHMYFKIKNH